MKLDRCWLALLTTLPAVLLRWIGAPKMVYFPLMSVEFVLVELPAIWEGIRERFVLSLPKPPTRGASFDVSLHGPIGKKVEMTIYGEGGCINYR